jgi:methionine sulfoxide reductase heme-binding subunit
MRWHHLSFQPAYLAASESPHDLGVHQVAALSARTAFVFLCLGLCWGVFTTTGWLHRLTGRQATRSSHIVFVTLALAFASLHALAFLFMQGERTDLAGLVVPMRSGGISPALGILALELMLAVALSAAAQRFLRHHQWLWVHRLGYPAVVLGVLHSFVAAAIDDNLAALWLFGVAILVPTAVVVALRFMPARVLTGAGLLKVER